MPAPPAGSSWAASWLGPSAALLPPGSRGSHIAARWKRLLSEEGPISCVALENVSATPGQKWLDCAFHTINYQHSRVHGPGDKKERHFASLFYKNTTIPSAASPLPGWQSARKEHPPGCRCDP